MFLDYSINHFWFAAFIISFLFLSDYLITRKCSALYHRGASKTLDLEGGIELNPIWQEDIYKQKKINLKFLLIIIILIFLIYFIWKNFVPAGYSGPYEFLLGGIILSELFIHTRHFKNLFLFKEILGKRIIGEIKYTRPSMHYLAAKDAVVFALFYLVLALLVGRAFFWGGAFSCLNLALIQKFWLKRTLKISKTLS